MDTIKPEDHREALLCVHCKSVNLDIHVTRQNISESSPAIIYCRDCCESADATVKINTTTNR